MFSLPELVDALVMMQNEMSFIPSVIAFRIVHNQRRIRNTSREEKAVSAPGPTRKRRYFAREDRINPPRRLRFNLKTDGWSGG
jgi:hypothetical protein